MRTVTEITDYFTHFSKHVAYEAAAKQMLRLVLDLQTSADFSDAIFNTAMLTLLMGFPPYYIQIEALPEEGKFGVYLHKFQHRDSIYEEQADEGLILFVLKRLINEIRQGKYE